MQKIRDPKSADVKIGANIRARRVELGLSQENLAAAIGVTFQQVQKYEKGTNRVGGSRMLGIAKALSTSVERLFDGAGETDAAETDDRASLSTAAFLGSREGRRIINAFSKITDAKIRRRITQLVETLAGIEQEGEAAQ